MNLRLLVILAIIGLVGFLIIAANAPFKNEALDILYPKPLSHAQTLTTANVTITSAPVGMQITYDGVTKTTPFIVQATVGSNHTLGVIASQQGATAFQESNGQVEFEAEDYRINIPRGDHQWVKNTTTQWGAFGGSGIMLALPENNIEIETNYATNSPELQYDINFQTPGVYYIWTRGRGASGILRDYAIHGGLNGIPLSSAVAMGSHSPNIFEWLSNRINGQPRATLTITNPGVHTLSIWMDHDSFKFDQVMLRQNPDTNFPFYHLGVNTNISPKTTTNNYFFKNWSDNGAISHQITIPAVDTVYTAFFSTSNSSPGPTAVPTTPPLPTPTPLPTPVITPPPGSAGAIFDDLPGQNQVLTGQYPAGVVDWGSSNTWYLSAPYGQLTTKNVTFNGVGITSGSFAVLSDRILINLQAFNGGVSASTVTISCSGQPTRTFTLNPNTLQSLSPSWPATCTPITLSSSNGWDTNFDNLLFSAVGPVPTAILLQGDADKNGRVDIFDYNIVLRDYGQTGTFQGDLDKDSDCDIFDYNILLRDYGKTS